MKPRHFLNFLIAIFLSFALSSCLIFESVRLKLDLTNMSGQIEYLNLVSTIEKKESYWTNDLEKEEFMEELKEERIEDLEELLKEYKDLSGTPDKKIISKELVRENNQLNGIEKFQLRSLEEFDITISPDGSKYMMKLDDSDRYMDGNGFFLKTDTANYITWDVDIKNIDVTIKVYDLEKDFDYTKSMLSYWEKWKENDKE